MRRDFAARRMAIMCGLVTFAALAPSLPGQTKLQPPRQQQAQHQHPYYQYPYVLPPQQAWGQHSQQAQAFYQHWLAEQQRLQVQWAHSQQAPSGQYQALPPAAPSPTAGSPGHANQSFAAGQSQFAPGKSSGSPSLSESRQTFLRRQPPADPAANQAGALTADAQTCQKQQVFLKRQPQVESDSLFAYASYSYFSQTVTTRTVTTQVQQQQTFIKRQSPAASMQQCQQQQSFLKRQQVSAGSLSQLGQYGSAFAAIASMAGVNNFFVAYLGGFSTVGFGSGLTCYVAPAWIVPWTGVPCLAGTYTIVANFDGSGQYNGTSAAATFTIAPAPKAAKSVTNGGSSKSTGVGLARTVKIVQASEISTTRQTFLAKGWGISVWRGSSECLFFAGLPRQQFRSPAQFSMQPFRRR